MEQQQLARCVNAPDDMRWHQLLLRDCSDSCSTVQRRCQCATHCHCCTLGSWQCVIFVCCCTHCRCCTLRFWQCVCHLWQHKPKLTCHGFTCTTSTRCVHPYYSLQSAVCTCSPTCTHYPCNMCHYHKHLKCLKRHTVQVHVNTCMTAQPGPRPGLGWLHLLSWAAFTVVSHWSLHNALVLTCTQLILFSARTTSMDCSH